MSSPHAAGCVALLLSACKKNGIPCNPNRIRRALQNTAKKMDSLSNLQQGHGMIQVDKAWEYLLANKDDPYEDVRFFEFWRGYIRAAYTYNRTQNVTCFYLSSSFDFYYVSG